MTDPYEKLANAIVLAAVKDWRGARRKLRRKPQNKDAQATVWECERFFRSPGFQKLTDLDGEFLIQRLYKEEGQ